MPVRNRLSAAKRRLMKYPFFPAINMPFRAYGTGGSYIFPIIENWTILGDNSHITSKLAEFSMREGRRFVFLAEDPANHWYRGAGIGVSWKIT